MDIRVPAFYILDRKIEREFAAPIYHALGIHPVWCGLVSDIKDADLAMMFTRQVLRCDTEEDTLKLAHQMSQDKGMPVLVIGTADLLDAVYPDGVREPVAAIQ